MDKFRILLSSFLFLTFLLIPNVSYSQIIDTFTDGDFTSNPTWSGNTSDWRILTNSTVAAGASNSFTLGLDAQAVSSGTKYLSTQRTANWGSEQSWSFWIGRRGTAASSGNQNIVWLYANEANLTSLTVDGYRIVFGNSGDDNIILQSVTNGVGSNIIISTGTVKSTTDIGFMVRVTRTSSSLWTLYTSTLPTAIGDGAIATDVPSKANVSIFQGSVTNSTITDFSNGYFGFVGVHTSSASARIAAEFDQFYFDVSATAPLPVEVTSFKAIQSKNYVELKWQTATEVNNYGFDIERKVPDQLSRVGGQIRNDGSGWYKIGFVHGHGDSNTPIDYTFVDKNAIGATSFYYRLKQIDVDGKYEYSEALLVKLNVPNKVELMQNSPNPFNLFTAIKFFIPKTSEVTVKIYDLLGKEVATLLNQKTTAGFHIVYWIGRDNFDNDVSSGVYLYRLTAGSFSDIKKMILLK